MTITIMAQAPLFVCLSQNISEKLEIYLMRKFIEIKKQTKQQGFQRMILFVEIFVKLNVLIFQPSSGCVGY